MDSCRISVDLSGAVTATMHTTSSGQGHETLVATVVGEALELDPDRIRVVRPDSLESLPSNSPVGSRMAIMLGGAAFHAAQKLKAKLTAIAAHDLGIPPERAIYRDGDVIDREQPETPARVAGSRHHRASHFHRLPPGFEPGLSVEPHRCRCRPAAALPTPDGRVQMYPCYSFEFHLVLMAIDPDLGKPEIKRYVVGHDCGTVINPKIVRGMTLGGIAHGIGAALYEEFAYDDEGQLIDPELHGLPAAVLARSAADRDRPPRDALAAYGVRPEGLRRIRLSRRAGRDRQRRQRRACGRSGSRSTRRRSRSPGSAT